MICDRILGNIYAAAAAGDARACGTATSPPHDVVELAWFECFRRALRKKTRAGVTIRVLPPLGTTLQHGDVLGDDNRNPAAAVELLPCELWLVSPRDQVEMGVIAAELGNLHVPLEVRADGTLLVLPDGPAEGVLRRYGTRHERVTSRFSPLRGSVLEEFRLADGFKLTRGRDGPP